MITKLKKSHTAFTICLAVLGSLTVSLPTYAGGVSDGGGSVAIVKPMDNPWAVKTTIRFNAGKVLITYLRSLEKQFTNNPNDLVKKLSHYMFFSSQKNIFQIIQQTPVDLKMNEPCFDASSNPVDGSYSLQDGRICISAFQLSKKLNYLNFETETFALLLHEYSHLLGASEEQAVDIQYAALDKLKGSQVDRLFALIQSNAYMNNWAALPELMNKISTYQAHSVAPDEKDLEILLLRVRLLRDEMKALLSPFQIIPQSQLTSLESVLYNWDSSVLSLSPVELGMKLSDLQALLIKMRSDLQSLDQFHIPVFENR